MVSRYHALQLLEGSRAASLARFQLPTDDPRIAELSHIRSPTLVLWGEEDRLIPVADAQRFADAIPDSRVRIYPGVGHLRGPSGRRKRPAASGLGRAPSPARGGRVRPTPSHANFRSAERQAIDHATLVQEKGPRTALVSDIAHAPRLGEITS